jgi:hypothetical protein
MQVQTIFLKGIMIRPHMFANWKRSFGLITFAHILPNVFLGHITVSLRPSCKRLGTTSGSICCTMSWWSWVFMANNLFGLTCFLNAIDCPIGA